MQRTDEHAATKQENSWPETSRTQELLGLMLSFCFPGGEVPAKLIQAIRTTQQGQFRAAPEARWTPYSAKEYIESRRSAFRWEARIGTGLRTMGVTDAYEDGHGYLLVKAAGLIPLRKFTGPEFDKGELQRYLASIIFCPAIMLNHPSLEWTAAGPLTLRVRDHTDITGATVDLDLSEDGCPLRCRADRPRMLGKRTILTPWSGACRDFREWEGLRVASRLEVFWHLPEGPFLYLQGELTSFAVDKG